MKSGVHPWIGCGSKAVGDQSLGEAFWNDVGDFLPDQFIAAIAELFFRLNIEQDDLAALVHHHHRVRRRLEQSTVFAFHLRQMIFRGLACSDVAARSCDRERRLNGFHGFPVGRIIAYIYTRIPSATGSETT